MKKEKKLFIDTLIYGISSFGSKMLSFVLIPIYSKYFTKIEFGEWDLIATTISLIGPFVSLEIVSALYRWLLESKKSEEKVRVITTTFIFYLKNILLFTGIYFLVTYFYKINYSNLIYFMILFSQIDDYVLKCLRGLAKTKEFALIGVLKSIISFLAAILFIKVLNLKIETFIYSSIIASSIGIILGIYYSKLWNFIEFEKKSIELLVKMKKYSYPLIPGAVNWWIMNVSDRYVILLVLGVAENGSYAMANKFPALLTVINSVFFMAWQDNAIEEYNKKDTDEYYSKVFKYYSRVIYLALTVLIIINRPVLSYILAPEYSNIWRYTNFLYIATIFSFFSSFWGIGFHGSKNTSIILKTTLLGAILNVMINIVFIKKIGLYAAVFSTIVCYLVMWLFRIKAAKQFKIIINKVEFLILNTLVLFTILIAYFENIYFEILAILIVIIIYILINLEEIKKLISRLKKL